MKVWRDPPGATLPISPVPPIHLHAHKHPEASDVSRRCVRTIATGTCGAEAKSLPLI